MKQLKQLKIFQVPIIDWLPTTDLMIGLVLSSIFINITALIFPLTLIQIYDRIIPNQSIDTLHFLVIAIIGAITIGSILKVLRAYVSSWADTRLSYLSSVKTFKHIISCDITHYEKEGTGTHIERVNAIHTIKDFFGGQAITSIIDLPFVFLFLVAIAYIDARLLAIPVVILITLGFFIYYSSKKLLNKLQKREGSIEKKLNFVIEALSGIHTIKALGMESQLVRRYERLQNTAADEDYNLVVQNSKSMRLSIFAQQINVILIVCFGSYFAMQSSLTIGELTACILLSSRIIQPISIIIYLWSRMQSIKVAHSKNTEIHKKPLECMGNLKKHNDIKGTIHFENVSFRYSGMRPWILRNASFTIQGHKTTLILANETSSGKSSILGIVAGLLKQEEGHIKIDNKMLSEFDFSSYRKHIGYLSQDGALFSGTILENLTLFNIAENYDRAIEMSKTLGLDKIILHMPEGYQTMVGRTSDDSVSKGIKQRILIIRSLIYDPSIILFDEANSALDIQTDKLLKDYLIKIKDRKTIIMITHRPSFAKIADEVLLLKNQKLEHIMAEQYNHYLN